MRAWLQSLPGRAHAALSPASLADVLTVAARSAAPGTLPVDRPKQDGSGGRLPSFIVEKQERSIECIRYFHACYPLAQPGAKERAARLHATLCEQRDELMRLKQTLPSEDSNRRLVTERRINALLDMLFAAIHRYEQPAA
jgi:hypothetical protein